jgi:hypothetical protein
MLLCALNFLTFLLHFIMKKIIIAISILYFSTLNILAQKTFSDGEQLAGIGAGLVWLSNINFSLHYEICVKSNIFDDMSSLGIGAIAGCRTDNKTTIATYGAMHYEFIDNLDIAAGLMFGYIGNRIDLGILCSGRYYFKDKIAAFASLEVSKNMSNLNAGLSIKF